MIDIVEEPSQIENIAREILTLLFIHKDKKKPQLHKIVFDIIMSNPFINATKSQMNAVAREIVDFIIPNDE